MAGLVLDILWRIVTWGVVGFGVVVVLHALLGDWVGGLRHARRVRQGAVAGRPVLPRLRCPGGWGRVAWIVPVRVGCWYDMSAAKVEGDGRARCPECGRRSGARRLRTSRRRWRLGGVGVLVMAVGLAGRYSRDVYRDGWKAVPDELLVLVPFDERVWLETGTTGSHWVIESAAKEIQARDSRGELSAWASAWLGRRVQRRYARDPDYGVPRATREALDRLEGTAFSEGVESRPFVEAVRTIAATAGVAIEIDEDALRAASIEPERRVTIPAFGMMSCEQALDWACDRARAMRGWAKAEWDLRDGRIVVADEAGAYAVQRSLVVVRASTEGSGGFYLENMIVFLVCAERWSRNGGAQANSWPLGEGLACTTSGRDLARIERLVRVFDEAAGLDDRRAEKIREMAHRLEAAPITPIEGGDDLSTVLDRARAVSGVRVSVDPWGIDLHQTRQEVLVERGVIRVDRTAPWADPFGSVVGRDGVDVLPESGTIARGLADWGSPYVHDDTSLLIGLRAGLLLRRVVVYQLPPLPKTPVFNSNVRHQSNMAPEWREWSAQFGRLHASVETQVRPDQWTDVGGGFARTLRLGDRLIIVAPPDMQAAAAPTIEKLIEGWRDESARGQR